MASRLQRGGHQPLLVARGDHLQALQHSGLTVTEDEETRNYDVEALGDGDSLPDSDVVLVTLKAHSIPAAIPHLATTLKRNSAVLFAVNGIPWWYFHGLNNGLGQGTVKSVDPNGTIWQTIGPDRALGCVLYPAVELVQPGVIKHISGERVSIGEPSGGASERTDRLSELLNSGGIRTSVRKDIRNEMWIKLWGNVAFNPLSVLTGGTLDQLATNSGTQEIAMKLMEETQKIGRFYGARFGMTISKRIGNAAAVGAHKTSMLQDYLRSKPLETSAILDAVLELASKASIEAPTIRMVQSLLALKLANENHPT